MRINNHHVGDIEHNSHPGNDIQRALVLVDFIGTRRFWASWMDNPGRRHRSCTDSMGHEERLVPNQYEGKVIEGNQIKNILFFTTLLLQLAWTAYAFDAEGMESIDRFQRLISRSYSNFGLGWLGMGAYLMAATLLSSFLLNTARRALEGIFIGWPRFKWHDGNSVVRSITLLAGYGLMTYFAIGFFGQKYSSKSIHFYDALIIGMSTYIVGLLVDFIDDAISGIICIFFNRSKE